jgi:hypothetical protein
VRDRSVGRFHNIPFSALPPSRATGPPCGRSSRSRLEDGRRAIFDLVESLRSLENRPTFADPVHTTPTWASPPCPVVRFGAGGGSVRLCETDREPEQPHGHVSVEDGWRKSS